MKKHSLIISIFIGIASFWGINLLPEELHYLFWIAGTVWSLFFVFAVLHQENSNSFSKSIIFGILVLHLSALLSGPILEDDFYRYSWDGRNIRQGVHPYSLTPYEQVSDMSSEIDDFSFSELHLEEELKEFPAYTEKINYPMYRTVYPPLAEFLFTSEILVPNSHLGWPIFIFLADLIFIYFLFRKSALPFKFSSLILANPLFVKEGLNSLHFDFFLVPLLFIFLFKAKKNHPLVLGLICGLRPWFLALILWRWKDWELKDHTIFLATLGLPWLALFIYPGFPSQGFSSWSAFVKGWEFNALFYECLRQLSGLLTGNEVVFRAAAWITGFSAIAIFWKFNKGKTAFGVAAIAVWILFLPTVNPWYIMPIATVLAVNEDIKLKAFGCALTACLPLAYIHYEHFTPGTIQALGWALFELTAGYAVYIFALKMNKKNLTNRQVSEA